MCGLFFARCKCGIASRNSPDSMLPKSAKPFSAALPKAESSTSTATAWLGASAFARTVLDEIDGEVPEVRFAEERAMGAAVTDLADRGLVPACHDVSDGGLVVAVVEMAAVCCRRARATVAVGDEGVRT